MIFIVSAPNPRGFPIGTILNSCTITLIEPDVALTAGHCVASSAQNGQPPWLRAVASFDRENTMDESTWIDFAGTAVHPTMPHCMGPCTGDGGDPGIQDTGLIFLANEVPGITPSKLAPRNTLQAVERLQNIFDFNMPMAFAGYGTTDYNGGDFVYLGLAPHRNHDVRRGYRRELGVLEQRTQRRMLRGFRRADLRARGLAAAHRRDHQRRGRHLRGQRGRDARSGGHQIRSRLDQGDHRGSMSPDPAVS